MEFSVPLDAPFSLEHTLEGGQLFRWDRRGDWWVGVVEGSVLKLRQEGDVLRCSSSSDHLDNSFISRYFRFDADLDHILASISKGEAVTRAAEKYYGLRLVSQDPWECLASFVLATNANIPRIKKMVSAVCVRYGEPIEHEGERYATFPKPEVLASAGRTDLIQCGLGYRAPFLKGVAMSTAAGEMDLARVKRLGYEDARNLLVSELFGRKLLLGVGPKVADCVLLYSCGKDEAFPIDVWIARALAKEYPRLLGPTFRRRLAADPKAKLSPSDYVGISKKARRYFGAYAGYAQQYLFVAAREENL